MPDALLADAEQVNYKTLADAAEISQPTAKEWARLLQGLGIIYLLPPYSNNELKRLVKTPKLYFCDTELLKSFSYAPFKANLTYYRDSNAKEIDVFVEENGVIFRLIAKTVSFPAI